MDAIAVIPVKSFGEAKQRLSGALPGPERAALVEAMAADVLDALGRCERLSAVLVVSSESAIIALAAGHGLEVINDPGGLGHSEAASLGVTRAISLGADCVALLPADCPLVVPDEVDAALGRMTSSSLAIIPDRHGVGTNGLLIAPPDGVTPSFGPGSRERHAELAEAGGLNAHLEEIPSLALDLDTPEDFEHLRAALTAYPTRAPHTTAAIAVLAA